MARSMSHKSQPVTPQRLPAQRPHHRYSSSQSFYRSPITPASPYTPLSLRSFTSSASGASSTLTTPDHLGLGVKRLSFSPDVVGAATGAGGIDSSLAVIADNWRSRASENGIKVSSINDDSHFGDDEASERTLSDSANDCGFISTEQASLAPSLISNQRRTGLAARPRAQSHVPPPTSREFSSPSYTRSTRTPAQPPSPLVARRLNQAQNANVTSTPPQNRALARQLKLKGSFTDPAHTRRREAFGPLRTPAQNTMNINKTFSLGLNRETTLDLFDIDENDFENDFDNDYDSYVHDQGSDGADRDDMDLSFLSKPNSLNFNNLNMNMNAAPTYGYPSYPPPLLPSYGQQQQFFTSHAQAPFADPFQGNVLSSITENVEHYFHTQHQAFGEPNLYPHGRSHQPWGAAGPAAPSATRPSPAPGARDGYNGGPAWVPVPTVSIATPTKAKEVSSTPVAAKPTSTPKKASTSASGCSVCLAPSPRTLAVLAPCGHPLCSGCLTSALNIVGEKDMECAVCRGQVADFKLIVGGGAGGTQGPGEKADPGACKSETVDERRSDSEEKDDGQRWETKGTKAFEGGNGPKSFMDPLLSSPESGVGNVEGGALNGLESAFEFGLGLEEVRASTPKRDLEGQIKREQGQVNGEHHKKLREYGRGKGKGEENVVLRIDNVPWDITPPQIQKWLQHPLERVHVLLDKRGKTMSHAYVEVADVAVAGKILRGEAIGTRAGGKPRERGSVLGKGRRARGVTVTRTGQEELMADLFPNWRGSFDSSRPSLAGLDNERVISALEGGLIGESEVVGLLHLIKEPDVSRHVSSDVELVSPHSLQSHFLKAPSLPFHSLISILSKFPADVDSRVFWSSGVRDMLYDVTYAAVQILLSRVNANSKVAHDNEYSVELVSGLVKTALGCHGMSPSMLIIVQHSSHPLIPAFTDQQLNKFTEFLESRSLPLPSPNTASRSASSARSEPRTPETRDLYGRVSNVSTVAVEGEAPRLSPSPGGEGEDGDTLASLAREFGVEAQLVQALAQRLAGL
ncbi:hypothetical protein DXG03_008663, partial [Asterophora parasitica]